jgi:PAS domain S-box-containing protein
MASPTDNFAPIESILCTEQLQHRPSRARDHDKENRALVRLIGALASSPQTILQTLADTILEVLDCGSAGVSLLSKDGGTRFYWPAIAGAWKQHIGGGTPRDFGPCGDVLDRNATLLFQHVERRYTYFQPVTPVVEEALLVPFYVAGRAMGTIWAVAHDPERKFDAEDQRQLESMARFASAAYQAVAAIDASRHTTAIVESSDDAIISKDLNGIIGSWNRSAERLFGYTAEEAIGKPITLIIPPDRRDEEISILARLRQGERVEHFETVRVRKDGGALDISLTISPVKDSAGHVTGASKVARDITERKRGERKLRESEERFRAIFAATPECVKLVASDGTLLQMNSSGLGMVGADSAEMVVGKSVYDLIAPEYREKFRDFNESVCRGEKLTLEFDIVGLTGERRSMESQGAPLKMDTGDIVQLAVTRDISERKKVEEARQEAEVSGRLLKVQDGERRRIARELHDGVGQLLTAIGMNVAQVAKERESLSTAAARCVEDNQALIAEASREIRTVSYLLHPPMLDEVGLATALRWFAEGFSERSKIKVELDLASDVGQLPQDYELSLFRIAQEALTNVHRHSESKTAFLRLARSGQNIELAVKDEGRGISPEVQSKITAGASTGVGFRGMQERIKQIGGTLTIESNGNGSVVLVSLPVVESSSGRIEDAPRPQS